MAFTFPRRSPELLYFPTLHIHDREVHPQARFDHKLYCQVDTPMEEYLGDWQRSQRSAAAFMDIARSEGIIDPDRSCWCLPLEGRLQNRDTLIGEGGGVPQYEHHSG
jgi:hypothetical protein